jgi:hypothetical protein
LDPMGKMFQNASSLKPNCPGMIIGRSSVFYADRKSKMAATTGDSINTEPYRENTQISSSLKLLHWLNLNCASIIGRSFTNFVFFMLIVIPRWLPVHSFYIGPIGFFYNQVNDTGSWEPLVIYFIVMVTYIKGKTNHLKKKRHLQDESSLFLVYFYEWHIILFFYFIFDIYSQTSVPRTRMSRIPWMARTDFPYMSK